MTEAAMEFREEMPEQELPQKQPPSLERIQRRMREGELTKHGFLGDDSRDLSDIIREDTLAVEAHGLSHEALARRLREILEAGDAPQEQTETVEGRWSVRSREDRGTLPCPWGDGQYGTREFTLTDRETGRTFRLNALSVHMIGSHGFYQGHGAVYRNDPTDLIPALGLAGDPGTEGESA
jgi:hypothetical protein